MKFKHLLFVCLTFSVSHYASASCDTSKVSFTVNSSISCDTSWAYIQNTSTLPLNRVSSFQWDFGNGIVIKGDSIKNTEFWTGPSGDGKLKHLYRKNGSFKITLTVWDDSLCYYEKKKKSATNIKPPSEIESKINYNGICFRLKKPFANYGSFLWNFGDPASGPDNFNSQSIAACHNYSVGSYMISLRIQNGPCLFMRYDTIQIKGPLAQIEAPFSRIKPQEKYQCSSNDSVHFTNNSLFYHNDSDTSDEDSVIIVNGKRQLLFNFDTIGMTGDQTALASAQHIANRTRGAQIKTFWDFGDMYAPACTTSTKKGLNIGRNCNYSEDEFPVHKYMPWDSIYRAYFYKPNKTFCEIRYDSTLKEYKGFTVDTSDAKNHYKIFKATQIRNYYPRLWLKDTISQKESSDYLEIMIGKPDASKLSITSKSICPQSPNLTNYVEFDLGTGGQSYFAVNFDSLKDPNDFSAFNSGKILAQSKPESPIPFTLPYDIAGNYPDQFVKSYYPSDIGSYGDRSPEGSFTIGLIVGNGPLTNNIPACADTQWYHDFFQLQPLNAKFKIPGTANDQVHICPGDEIIFKLEEENQRNIEYLTWSWNGFSNSVKSDYETYWEEFFYFKPYKGPSPTRNDQHILYNGEDWFYNYVIRKKRLKTGTETIDTIVTSIVKDWKTKISDETSLIYEAFGKLSCYHDLGPYEMPLLLGTLIDTTGWGNSIIFDRSEYIPWNGDATFMHGNKRYRYLNDQHTDSIEVAHVLHFRDSSLRGYDTLINGTDTTFGVWKHHYTNTKKDKNGIAHTKDVSGPMIPTLVLQNRDNCAEQHHAFVNVGFYSEFTTNGIGEDTFTLCADDTLFVFDKIRYWKHDPYTFNTLDTHNYWRYPWRYFKQESFEFDWDDSDGVWDKDRTLTPWHQYNKAGQYTVSVAMKDSVGCVDTAQFTVNLTNPKVAFGIKDQTVDCTYEVLFSDSSSMARSTIHEWNWDFGDQNNSTDQNPSHSYSDTGTYQVKLLVKSEQGCQDSLVKSVRIKSKKTIASPSFTYSLNERTFTSINQSSFPKNSYRWDWGDGTGTEDGYNATHTYKEDKTFTVCLTRIDSGTGCKANSCLPIAVGACNAKFGYSKDSSTKFMVVLHDSSTGNNLSYVWYWGDGDSSTLPKPKHDYQTFGKFLVTLKVSNSNCISVFSDSLGMDTSGKLLKADGFSIRVDSLASIGQLNLETLVLYPNPSDGKVYLMIEPKGTKNTILVYNNLGKLVQSSVCRSQPCLIELPPASGIYYVQVISQEGNIFRQKIIRR